MISREIRTRPDYGTGPIHTQRNQIIRDQRMSPCDEIQGALAFADSTLTQYQNTYAAYMHQNPLDVQPLTQEFLQFAMKVSRETCAR
jgi:hypothetical protein